MQTSGIINLNKSPGISSARAVAVVKRLLPRGTKIGHAGTLDPFASGVLLLLIGKATRLCEKLMDQPKEYEGVIKLGATTPTDDPESDETPTVGVCRAQSDQVQAVLQSFVGETLQRPPAYSAMKIGGRRAYDLARRGDEVKLDARPVKIYRIDVLEFEWPHLKVQVECGRGTYIRALARDVGQKLGCGGYLTSLVRTRLGSFTLKNAATLEQLAEGPLEAQIIPLSQVAQLRGLEEPL